MVYRIFYVIAIFFFFTSCKSYDNLVFGEEFSGTTLNQKSWNFELGDGCPDLCGWGNNEEQIYTNKNHHIEDGNLIITIKKEDSIITSTRITTKNKVEFQYGKVEMRAKVPVGKGIWPAFWMLGANISEVGWPRCGEIDILEYVGREPDMVFTTIHNAAGFGDNGFSQKTKAPEVEDGFHTYGIIWNKKKIDFFYDKKKVYTYKPQEKNDKTWPFDAPFYILLNVAVGGNFGGPAVDYSIFPQEYVVDYIRVYQ